MSITETLEPTIDNPVTITFTLIDDSTFTYTQQPLSFFGKMELFSVLGGAVEKALSEDGGINLSSLLEVPQRSGATLSASDFNDATVFVRGIAKLVQFAPDLLKDVYCISLRVPRQERPYVKELMEEQLSDEQGVQLLDSFVDQNWDVMRSFFFEQIQPLVEKITKKVQDSAPSKPSKPTRQRTQKK